jgi:type II pantothenate kinase
MKPFCKLADPARYRACLWDLCKSAQARVYWCNYFCEHAPRILATAIESAIARGEPRDAVEQRAKTCLEQIVSRVRHFQKSHAQFEAVTILTFDQWRDGSFREHGFHDCFIDRKESENELMLPLLRPLIEELDALDEPQRLRAVIEGVFAGNIFDLGAHATAHRFMGGDSPDFHHVRETLPARPWRVDDYDLLEKTWLSQTYRKAVLFIDNAGSDFLLGAMPLAHWLAQRGTRVVIAANEKPTLNDMTIHDVRKWWPRIVDAVPSFGRLPLEFVSTGTAEPLINLARVSDELNDASADADLVIMEGMGRGVQTNYDANFTCDVLNIAMLKDTLVAQSFAGHLFDVVCRFRPARPLPHPHSTSLPLKAAVNAID